jgi:hypothetical protein
LHPEKYWQRQRPMQGGARAVSGRDKIEVHTSARPRSNLQFIYVNDCSITRSIAGRLSVLCIGQWRRAAPARSWPEGHCDHAAAARSSLSAPRITIFSASSVSGRCSAFASSHGARIHTSRSSSVVRTTFQTQSPQRETMQSFDVGDRGAWLQLDQPETARASDMAPCARNCILMASSCIQR